MRIMKRHQKCIVVIITIIVIILCSLSLLYDYCKNGNCVTMLAGLWSAAATAILGGIAYKQNKKYKQLSDQQNDLAFMPDLYISTALSDKRANALALAFSPKVRGIIDDIETDTCRSIGLWFLKGPILNLKVVEIQHGKEAWTCSEYYQKSFRDESEPISLELDIPKNFSKEDNSFTAVLEYENVYGTRYQKKIPFSINNGSLNPDVEKLERAHRIDNR